MAEPSSALRLLAVGDLQVMTRDVAPDLFEHVASDLMAADITFGNCEWPYAEEAGDTHPVEAHINDDFAAGDLFAPGSPDAIRLMGESGFDVMSVANNHTMHGGYRAFLRTISLLQAADIAPVGGGSDIAEARRPAIIERQGCKVAFLACTSGFLPGAHAGKRTPGIVPLRRHSYFENPAWEQWGIEPDLRTLVNREDLSALCASIVQARDVADVVVVSCHWGILEDVVKIGDYQRDAARAMIDAGADLIVSQGPLAIKGFEIYRGKAVLYSMGKFVMVSPWMSSEPPSGISAPILDEARRGLAASVTIKGGAIADVTLVPVATDERRRPLFLARGREQFASTLADVVSRTRAAGLNGCLDENGRVRFP